MRTEEERKGSFGTAREADAFLMLPCTPPRSSRIAGGGRVDNLCASAVAVLSGTST
ncbi:hypothetical protein PGT21_023808 [Puccinia graminis f. sp. tritici]|uniref:Uncharacterized protein n=1 Tax=Puccinia graminis f. sp. tritici TaxID=56615 RepID=A0A5B0M0X4_PUCGR|nr:hypothetical protein PGT21_023808 [Puccinia graminis f. sp. tritici]KAA1075438.1 hypothetical protein PGTUg99_005709 [Puccinia graminis f. sp. tritici]